LATIEANQVTNVQLFPVALGEKVGWSYFTAHLGSNGGLVDREASHYVDGGGWIVPTFRLDDLVHDHVDFIKVDVEGAEARALQGALNTIRKCRPVIVSELSFEMLRRVSGTDPLDYLVLFEELGYRLNILDRASPGTLLPFGSSSELVKNWGDNALRIEDLLFLPA
jgi:hypothetical protein